MASEEGKGRPAGPRGTSVRAGGKDGPQRIESGGKRWTEEAEELFLDRLAATANVTAAARAAGFSREAIYRRRRHDPAFQERWRAAVAQAYARIELALVSRAEAALAGFAPDPDTPIPVMTVADAVALLKLHHAQVHGGEGSRPGWPARPRSLDEVGNSILRKLAAIEALPPEDEDAEDDAALGAEEAGEAVARAAGEGGD